MKNIDDYYTYAWKSMGLTESWQKFTLGFQLPSDAANNLRIDFFLGGSGGSPVTIWIDGVTLVAGSASPEFNALTVRDDGEVIVGGAVGIGTTEPGEKLDVNGNIQISGSGNGLILKSPDSHRWKLTIDNNGTASWADLGI